MSDWHLLLEKQPAAAAENMAVDEWLYELCHRKKCGFLRLYLWSHPSFSFGVSQKCTRAIDCDFIVRNSCEYVRRITGGKTVLHDDELTYAVVSSEDLFYCDHDLFQSYLLISRVLIKALNQLNIPAYLSDGSTPEMSRSSHPCFSFPTPNEIEVKGKKIIGSAQKRDKFALLQHGSIPFTMDYNLYAGGSNSEAAFIQKSMTTMTDITEVSKENLIEAILSSFQEFIGEELKNFDRSQIEGDAHFKDLIKKYSSDQWNFSR